MLVVFMMVGRLSLKMTISVTPIVGHRRCSTKLTIPATTFSQMVALHSCKVYRVLTVTDIIIILLPTPYCRAGLPCTSAQ